MLPNPFRTVCLRRTPTRAELCPDHYPVSLTPPPPPVRSFPPLGLCVCARACVCSEESIAVKGRPRAEFRLAKALTSAMKTLSANKEARVSVDCIDGDRDLA